MNQNLLVSELLAIISSYEKDIHSRRTIVALDKIKLNGKRLGSPQNLTDVSRQRSIESRKAKKQQCPNWNTAIPIISKLFYQGNGLTDIAVHLNTNGYKTKNNKMFTATTVRRLIIENSIRNTTG